MRSLLTLALGAGLWLAPSGALAQIALATNQGLSFGTMLPGVTQTVNAQTNVASRAVLVFSGNGRASVSFTLPANLTQQQTGVPQTLTFGAADGLLSDFTGNTPFDPRLGTNLKLVGSHNTATIYLGGQVRAANAQPAGTYRGTIVVTVAP